MRRNEREIKSRTEINAVLKKAVVCRLGLVDGNMPYVVPMNFGYQGNSIYVHSAKEGRKLDIIRRNNNVCFEVDADQVLVTAEKACNWGLKYRSVIGNGKAYFVESTADKIAALKLIMAHYTERSFEFSETDAASVAVIRIELESISGKKARWD